jgi:hypothetical protein
MESIYLEKSETEKNDNNGVIFEKKANLEKVSEEIFENHRFESGDIVLLDNDETLIPTWECFLLNKPFENIPKDSRTLLKTCEERDIRKAIVTNMPREGHYMNGNIDVFGYEHYFQDKFLKRVEFPVSLLLGSMYKEGGRCLYEVATWVMEDTRDDRKVAWIGNSHFDQGFGYRLERTLRSFDFKGMFFMYKLPWLRSFKKS